MTTEPEKTTTPNSATFEGTGERRTTLFGLAYWGRDDQGRFRLRFLWRRVFATGLGLGLAGWLGLSTAAWWFVTEKRHVPDVSFFDIAFPGRWGVYQKKRGDAYIEQAKEMLNKSLYREAFQLLRIGVAKSPANLEGRLELAKIYQAIRRIDHAATVMEGGLPYADDHPDFLGAYVQMLLAHRMDPEVEQLAERLLPEYAPDSRQAQLLALGAATAAYLRGDYDQAEAFLARADLSRAADASLLRAKIEWSRGHTEIALMRLRSLIAAHPDTEQPYTTMIDLLRESGRDNEADTIVIERAIAFPNSAPAQSALLATYSRSGNTPRLEREIESMLQHAPRNAAMFHALIDYAVTHGDVALADRLRALPQPEGIDSAAPFLAAIEARLAAAQYQSAIDEIDALQKDPPEWAAERKDVIAGFAAVAHYGVNDLKKARPLLGIFIDSARYNPPALLAVAERLLAAGALEAARETLEKAVEADAKNETMLARLIALDLEADSLPDLPQNTNRLFSLRKTSLELLRRLRSALGSDRFLFSTDRNRVLEQLDAVIARRESQERARPPGS